MSNVQIRPQCTTELLIARNASTGQLFAEKVGSYDRVEAKDVLRSAKEQKVPLRLTHSHPSTIATPSPADIGTLMHSSVISSKVQGYADSREYGKGEGVELGIELVVRLQKISEELRALRNTADAEGRKQRDAKQDEWMALLESRISSGVTTKVGV